jgi:2'-hydroxyisoflavone reductase
VSRVLVIGGTLFIGRALVRLLLERGDDVTILHRGAQNPFKGQTQEIQCDRNNISDITSALQKNNFELVFDNVYDWQRGTTAAHVEAAATACGPELQRYVFMSSCAAYGSGLDLTEVAPLAPPESPLWRPMSHLGRALGRSKSTGADQYCRNKADSERLLFRLHQENGFPAVTLRPPHVYGPENPFYREAFFWDRLTTARPVIVPGDGTRLMQFILAGDLAQAAIQAADSPIAAGKAYNIANAAAVTQTALVESIAAAAGCDADIRYVPRERIEALGGNVFAPPLYFGQYFDLPPITENIERARQDLAFKPTPFEQGLHQAWEWYSSQLDRPTPDFSFDDKLLG